MKKGCFFTVLIILTVIIAAAIYLFKNHKDDAIALLKPMILNSLTEEYQEASEKYKITTNKAALDSIFTGYVEYAREKSDFKIEQLEKFFRRMTVVMEDGTVDSTEITQLRNLFQEAKLNERPEENRN